MSYAVKYKTNKGEEEMKKRRVAKLIALSMVAATLLTGVNVQAKEEKVVTAMTSIDLTPEPVSYTHLRDCPYCAKSAYMVCFV